MGASDVAFAGSIPGLYDRYLGPMVFEPYAAVMSERAKAMRPERILETAAGTGIVTAALHAALPDAEIVATDLNPDMLDIAARRTTSDKVRFSQADAQALPFADESFDLVACQFGVMFYPDKVLANSEARRVLRPGGHYLLAVWDRLDRNPVSHAVGGAMAKLYPDNPAAFLERLPFGYHDPAWIERDLRAAGFADIAIETVERRSRLGSARDAATGLIQGSPMRADIEPRAADALDKATEAGAEALRQFEGPDGLDAPMAAHIIVATK
jgi:SAM-dependent methyltransferase